MNVPDKNNKDLIEVFEIAQAAYYEVFQMMEVGWHKLLAEGYVRLLSRKVGKSKEIRTDTNTVFLKFCIEIVLDTTFEDDKSNLFSEFYLLSYPFWILWRRILILVYNWVKIVEPRLTNLDKF